MKDELQREYDDWQRIFEAYTRSHEEGLELQSGKEERCGLCPTYRKEIRHGDSTYLSCRECPCVIITGHTCSHWWREAKISPGDEAKSRESGERIAFMAKEFIKRLIEMVE